MTGEKFYATAIEKGEFEKEIRMPASGDSSFVVVFPKLKKNVTRLDYGDGKTYFFGISLDGKEPARQAKAAIPDEVNRWIRSRLDRTKDKPLIDYASPAFFTRDTARLIGYIKGYDPRAGFSTGIIYATNVITNEDFPVTVELLSDGRFEAAIPMSYPKYTTVYFQDRPVSIYLEPGHTLAMVLDWEDFLTADRLRNTRYVFKKVEYLGPLARINRELNTINKKEPGDNQLMKAVKSVLPADFHARQLAAWRSDSTALEKELENGDWLSQTRTIARHKLNLGHATYLLDYTLYRQFEMQKDTGNQVLKAPLQEDFHGFLRRLPLDDPSLLIVGDAGTFLNRFEFSEPFGGIMRTVQAIPAGPEKTITARARLIRTWRAKDSVLTAHFQLQPNLFYDITKVRSLKYAFTQQLKDNKDGARSFLTTFEDGIRHPFLKEEAEDQFYRAYPAQASEGYALAPGKGTDIFRKIIDPHRGKLLFVDFWATSCGPCVGGIQRMKGTRAQFKGHPDLEFLFITSEAESPEGRYNTFVAEQDLKITHRLKADDYLRLRQLFKFNGIPRYVLIGRDGQVLNDDFPMHNFTTEVQKLLPAPGTRAQHRSPEPDML